MPSSYSTVFYLFLSILWNIKFTIFHWCKWKLRISWIQKTVLLSDFVLNVNCVKLLNQATKLFHPPKSFVIYFNLCSGKAVSHWTFSLGMYKTAPTKASSTLCISLLIFCWSDEWTGILFHKFKYIGLLLLKNNFSFLYY